MYLIEMAAAAALMAAACICFRLAELAGPAPWLFDRLPARASVRRWLAWVFLLVSVVPPFWVLGWEVGLPVWLIMLGLLALSVLLIQALSAPLFMMMATPVTLLGVAVPGLVFLLRLLP